MDKDTKRVVRAAVQRGWKLLDNSKHHVLRHPSGRKVTFSMSPSCSHAYKHVQRDIDRVEREAPAAPLLTQPPTGATQ